MKIITKYFIFILILSCFAACRSNFDFAQRKYMPGKYVDGTENQKSVAKKSLPAEKISPIISRIEEKNVGLRKNNVEREKIILKKFPESNFVQKSIEIKKKSSTTQKKEEDDINYKGTGYKSLIMLIAGCAIFLLLLGQFILFPSAPFLIASEFSIFLIIVMGALFALAFWLSIITVFRYLLIEDEKEKIIKKRDFNFALTTLGLYILGVLGILFLFIV